MIGGRGILRMSLQMLVTFLGYVEIVLCVAALGFIVSRRQWREYWAVGSLLAVRVISSIVLWLIWHEAHYPGADKHAAYKVYFYVYWGTYAAESILVLVILYSIFRLTTAPLQGLQKLGMWVLGSVAVISVMLTLSSAFAPRMTGMMYMVRSISQLQRMQSILTLGLVLFVFFAIRPMGLSFKSRVFGVSLGLAIMAITDLVQSAWLTHNPRMNTFFNILNGVVVCAVLAIWAGYFAMQEPERREIMLPANSVFVRLNRMGLGWFG
jgi:hypothetical protein